MMADRDNTSRWTVPLLGAAAGAVMADPNVAGTALVEASRGLSMPTDWIPVAASIENYTTAATVVSTGLLADRLGRRRVLLVALLVMIAAELVTAVAPGPTVYLCGRALTGLATGAVFGSAFAFVRHVVPEGGLGAGLGVFGAVATVVMMVTSVAGGSMAALSWRLGFMTVAGVAMIVVVWAPRLLPKVPRIGTGPLDLVGQALLGLGVVLPLFGLSRAGTPGSPSSSEPCVWAASCLWNGVDQPRSSLSPSSGTDVTSELSCWGCRSTQPWPSCCCSWPTSGSTWSGGAPGRCPWRRCLPSFPVWPHRCMRGTACPQGRSRARWQLSDVS